MKPIKVAFCSDCDGMTWESYTKVHALCKNLELPAGDSFWLFDASGCSEMSLFGSDMSQKQPYHSALLEKIQAGELDVLHSIGDFSRPDSSYPTRGQISEALDYLKQHQAKVNVYTSHGNHYNYYCIAGSTRKRTFQRGDLPFSQYFITDLLDEYGIEYYWASDLFQNLERPGRILRKEIFPDGKERYIFHRFGPWRGTAHTLPDLLHLDNIRRANDLGQNLIFFTHWGTKGASPAQPKLPLWHKENLQALVALAEMQQKGEVEVIRLGQLLDYEKEKTLAEEIDRIAPTICHEHFSSVNSYYSYAYTKMGAKNFSLLAQKSGWHGEHALDAGGGSGNLALHLTSFFSHVTCADSHVQALNLGLTIAKTLWLRQKMTFLEVNCQEHDFPANTFDAIFCRGALYSIGARRFTQKAFRALKPGRPFIFTFNADGTYQYFFDNNISPESYSRLMWNSVVRRLCSGQTFADLVAQKKILSTLQTGNTEMLFRTVLHEGIFNHAEVMQLYEGELRNTMADHLYRTLAHASGKPSITQPKVTVDLWECYLPEEIQPMLYEAGFKTVEVKTLAEMGLDPEPAFDFSDWYKGMPTVRYYFAVK